MTEHIIGEGPTNGELIVLIQSNDLRYQQRFETQEANLITAITAQEKAVAAALQAAKEAVTKAEIAAEKRFDAVNEFRGQLSDQARSFMPRAESELQITALNEKIENIQGLLGSLGGRSEGISAAVGYIVGAVGALVGIVGLVLSLTR